MTLIGFHRVITGMTPPIIGIIIAAVNVIIFTGAFIIAHLKWLNSRPKQTIKGVGIRYNEGTHEWPKMDCVIDHVHDVIAAKYGADFAEKFLSTIIVEVVAKDASRGTPTTIVSEETKIAGSIDYEREFPWSTNYGVAVILQRDVYATAGQSAAAHEIIKHLLPSYRGEGVNADHSRQDLNEMSDSCDNACQP